MSMQLKFDCYNLLHGRLSTSCSSFELDPGPREVFGYILTVVVSKEARFCREASNL